ncbi:MULTISPECIES: hypothetical protein [unclassified Nostoc]|uniref:hypothetical protein n=1 Tax=unclassified Nostoc TaxID=2593658 RepID=UPI002AD463F4|nr:hypothetical protein [Nostoc sp. ChiQUE02]MDZ8229041.1 hypothetical protein [Nostoc sp. ChiQUE02]
MPCIQVDVKVTPHKAIHAPKAEASKSEVIMDALNHYPECTEDMPNPDLNPSIELIKGRTSHHLWHQMSQTIYISTPQHSSLV